MKGLCLVVLAAAGLAASAGTASAQANPMERDNPCDVSDPPFPLTESNRLDDQRLAERLDGKTFVVQRRLMQDRRRPFERVMTYYFRSDGSLRISCRYRKQEGGDLNPCEGWGPSSTLSAANATDIATWRIDRGRVCWQRSRNDRDLCFFVHEADGRGYARLDGGKRVSCFEGDLPFK